MTSYSVNVLTSGATGLIENDVACDSRRKDIAYMPVSYAESRGTRPTGVELISGEHEEANVRRSNPPSLAATCFAALPRE